MPKKYLNNNETGWLKIHSLSSIIWLGLILLLLTVSCGRSDDDPGNWLENRPQEPLIMVLKNQSDEFSQQVSGQVIKALEYTKIPFFTVDLNIISQAFEIPQNVRAVVITNEIYEDLSDADINHMTEYVIRGGTVLFTGPFASEKTAYLQGIRPDASYSIDEENTGIYLYEDVFPEMKQALYNPKGTLIHKGIKGSEFVSDIEILAGTATDPKAPFMVSNKVGLGEVITINSYAIHEKQYRGFIFSALLKGLKGIPYQVANVSSIFLDDFPAPLYNEKMPPIDQEYGITHAEFVRSVWWPDMKALGDSLGLRYSAMTAFNYNANIVPPFDFQEWESGKVSQDGRMVSGSILLAQDVEASEHELAFHGYNHFSLLEEEWGSMNFMISSLQAARKRWQIDDLGSLPTNYVPPTNQIDSLGLEALIRGMPSIRYMNSLYLGQIEMGGGREFGPDPYVPNQLFNYPRISSGFTMRSQSLFDQQGMQLLTGIWSHFIHPDDVFQVIQRDDDEFSSRNPLGLGWKTTPGKDYGLYDLLLDRIEFTQQRYPLNRYVDATEGAKRTQDWRRQFSHYAVDDNSLIIRKAYRSNYKPHYQDSASYWYMYVTNAELPEVESALVQQNIEYTSSSIWEGRLMQFQTKSDSIRLPNLHERFQYDSQFVEALVRDKLTEANQYFVPPNAAAQLQAWRDTRLEEAVRAWKQNPTYANEERLIELSVEFSQVPRAIQVLEERLLRMEEWSKSDMKRLVTFYGWEGMQDRAVSFLEQLWMKFGSQKVITLQKMAIQELGLYGEAFERKWNLRELQLNPSDEQLLMSYTRSIESQENWPEMKKNLRTLIRSNPDSDSLYAYTLQRSFYYESADSTLALVESFPADSYMQLQPFASNLAYMYAYEADNFEKALFWANNAPDFDKRQKLYFMQELNLNNLFLASSLQLVRENPDDRELRSFIGTNLFYEEFREEAFQVLYPLFEQRMEEGLAADTLIRNEIGYMSYDQKKEFYQRYPSFFDEDQVIQLKSTARKTEAPKVSVFGEYRDDNFDNTFGRGGVSVEFGNRNIQTHSIKTEYLLLANNIAGANSTLQYKGAGYSYMRKTNEQKGVFNAGTALLFGESKLIPEVLLSYGYSQDSTYTSVQLKGGSELTASALEENYYQSEAQVFRQDYWLNGLLNTQAFASGKYYTNKVFRYSGQVRAYLEWMESKWKWKPIAEIAYADATKSYLSGIPYYAPDKYFSQGLGVEMLYRNPDSFDYQTQLRGEWMAKYERRDQFYMSGVLQLDHKFDNFWEITLGTEISTSKVYRSNRFFFSLSYYFPE